MKETASFLTTNLKKKINSSSNIGQDQDNDLLRSKPQQINVITNIKKENSNPELFQSRKVLMIAKSLIMLRIRTT